MISYFSGRARLITAPDSTILFLKKKNQKDFRAHPYGMLWQGLTACIKLWQPRPIYHSGQPIVLNRTLAFTIARARMADNGISIGAWWGL